MNKSNRLKKASKTNEDVEKCVTELIGLEKFYNKTIVYKAARRYNDRIYLINKSKKKPKKSRKSKKSKK